MITISDVLSWSTCLGQKSQNSLKYDINGAIYNTLLRSPWSQLSILYIGILSIWLESINAMYNKY